jgi:hypothetical protein
MLWNLSVIDLRVKIAFSHDGRLDLLVEEVREVESGRSRNSEAKTLFIVVPESAERRAAALGVVMGSMMAGGTLADWATSEPGYVAIGAVAGWWAGARLWNRWVADEKKADALEEG